MRGKRSGELLARVRWPSRGGAAGTRGRPGDDGRLRALDWQAALAQLGPVGTRWDLAILCNLDAAAGRRPAAILAAINAQAESGRQLSPQVLSGRLRELERRGYIRHEDLSRMPLHRVYFLQPPGQRLIADLVTIVRPVHDACNGPAARASPIAER